jgi:transposase InsO family protein
MPWREETIMSLRYEFVQLANGEDANISALCERFGVTRATGYKWLERYRREGRPGLHDRSRKPHRSPTRTGEKLEQAILALRAQHPAWGGRKLKRRLTMLGYQGVPTASTITAILRRHGRINPEEAAKHTPWQRFERPAPNELWQMDFKGYFALATRGHCHPLTVLDDHSRFALGLQACADEQGATVQARLTPIFRRYGLPRQMLMDNGAPWAKTATHRHTALAVWLMRLGIRLLHGRARHPQTQGKEERFHRTLKLELLRAHVFDDLQHCQHAFDQWRAVYNLERPHEALDLAVPAARYRPSPRPFPEALAQVTYAPGEIVRKVQGKGEISYRNRYFFVSKAFHGYPVALRANENDGVMDVFFCHQKVTQIDLTEPD